MSLSSIQNIARNWRKQLILGLILLGALLVFYSPWLFETRGFFDDQLFYAYPGTSYLATSLSSGRFPFWITGLRDGMPFYTDLGMSVFYPPAWILAAFVSGGKLSVATFQWYMVLHLFLGGVFISLFLKELRCGFWARILGVMTFVFSGFMSLHFVHPSVLQTFVWIPLNLYFVARIHNSTSRMTYLYLILALAMSFLAGFPQVVVYTVYLMVCYWLFLAFQNCKAEAAGALPLLRGMGLEFLKVVGVVWVAVLLVAMQYLPTAENWMLSQRQSFGFLQIADLSLPWYYLIHALVPNVFGATLADGSGVPFWGFNKDTIDFKTWHGGAWMYWEFGFYAGQIAVIAVVALAFNVGRFWREQREALFFLFAIPVILLLMLGRYGGLFTIFYYLAPGFSMYRAPARVGCVLDLCLAVVVAVVVNMLLKGAPKLNFRGPLLVLGAGYVAVFAWFGFAGAAKFPELNNELFMKHAIGQIGISILLFCGLALLLWGISKTVKIEGEGKTAKIQKSGMAVWFLAGSVVLVFMDLYFAFHRFHQGKINPDDYFADRNGLINQMAKLRVQEGPFRFAQLRDGKLSEEVIFPRNTGCFYSTYEGLEGLTLFSLRDYGFSGLTNHQARLDIQNVGVYANGSLVSGQVSLMRNTNSLPRVKFYHDIHAYNDAPALCADLDLARLNYRSTMGVFSADCDKYGISTGSPPVGVRSEVHFISKTPEEYQISYRTTAPGIIFISESFYPGWEADGGKYPIVRAFGAFKGIVIKEAGSGMITVKFFPRIFKIGLAISLTTLGGLVLAFVLLRRRESVNNSKVFNR